MLYNVQEVSEDSKAFLLQGMFSNKLRLRLEPNVPSVMTAAGGHIKSNRKVPAYMNICKYINESHYSIPVY